jgi:hypothetical protein
MRISFCTLAIAGALLAPGLASAQDIFRIEMIGLEHCANFDNFKFNAKNNNDMWVTIIDDQEWDLSTNQECILHTNCVDIIGRTYQTGSKKQSFIGAQFVGANGFITFDATAALDKNGVVTKITGSFIQDAGNDPNSPSDPNNPADPNAECVSSGKFKSVERIVVPPP